jgi:deazaflavin-dependent oxidoreductase (nitroreductase family)
VPTSTSWLKDTAARCWNGFHRSVFQATNGRVLGDFFGMPVVMLTTTGRKTGKRRVTMLTSPLQEGDKVIIIASWGGDDRHPTWFLNLRENPDVQVTTRGRDRRMRAHVATGDERATFWPRVVKNYRGYGRYQERTEREIPVVVLEPVD